MHARPGRSCGPGTQAWPSTHAARRLLAPALCRPTDRRSVASHGGLVLHCCAHLHVHGTGGVHVASRAVSMHCRLPPSTGRRPHTWPSHPVAGRAMPWPVPSTPVGLRSAAQCAAAACSADDAPAAGAWSSDHRQAGPQAGANWQARTTGAWSSAGPLLDWVGLGRGQGGGAGGLCSCADRQLCGRHGTHRWPPRPCVALSRPCVALSIGQPGRAQHGVARPQPQRRCRRGGTRWSTALTRGRGADTGDCSVLRLAATCRPPRQQQKGCRYRTLGDHVTYVGCVAAMPRAPTQKHKGAAPWHSQHKRLRRQCAHTSIHTSAPVLDP